MQQAGKLRSFQFSPNGTIWSILLITALVFANSLGNGFIENFDDNLYILNNPMIKHIDWSGLKEIFTTFYSGGNFRLTCFPLTMLSYALEYKFFGLNPFAFHLTNYIFHLLNTMLVFIFLKRFTGKIWGAVIASLFFGIHPMHVESVAWISERKDVLYAFFFLLSLICYTKYILSEKKKSFWILTFIWFVLSLLSKSAAVCLPLVLVLMDYFHNKKISWQTFTSKIPFFVLALSSGFITLYSLRHSESMRDISSVFPLTDRIFLVSYSIVFYLLEAFSPFNLSVMHYYPIKSGSFLPLEYYLAPVLLLLLIWAISKSGRFKPILIFGLLFYFITIFLELQIIPDGQAIVAERYSYIPYIGIFFIAGEFFSEFRIGKAVIIFLAVLFSFLTFQRNKVWKNGDVLFRDVIDKYPQYGYGWYALGSSADYKNDYDSALYFYSKAIELAPFSPAPLINRGVIEVKKKNYDAAIFDYTKAIELEPTSASAYFNRGAAEEEEKRLPSAIADYNKALDFSPLFADCWYNRANCKNEAHDYSGAIADYTRAIELIPNPASAYYNRALAKLFSYDTSGACRDWLLARQYGNPRAEAALEKFCNNQK